MVLKLLARPQLGWSLYRHRYFPALGVRLQLSIEGGVPTVLAVYLHLVIVTVEVFVAWGEGPSEDSWTGRYDDTAI